MKSYDAIVIGVGGWGSATLYQLARRGLKVCGVEQFALGHDRGSSHGESRVIRMAYFMHPDYVPALRRAYELWRKLESEVEKNLMSLPGLLCIGEPDSAFIHGLETCYATHELPHERWTAQEAQRNFPQFHLSGDAMCYWDPLGGYLRADDCVRAHTDLAVRHGAHLVSGEKVLSIHDEAGGVRVKTTRQELHAAKVVITTGAFAPDLTMDLGGLVKAQRKVLFWYDVAEPATFSSDHFPVWIAKLGGRNFYGFPTLDGQTIKAAEDTGGQPLSDPEFVARDLQLEDEAELKPFLEELFGDRLGARNRHKTCLYENSDDRHFIIDRHPHRPNVVLALGGSGHGFKFCSAVGEIAADLVERDHSRWQQEIFRLGERAMVGAY